jgi:hypothetical protein
MTQPPANVVALAESRVAARAQKDFALSDSLRDEIAAAGWIVADSKEGYSLIPKPPFDQLASLSLMPDNSAIADQHDVVIDLVVDGWSQDTQTCINALLQFAPASAHIAVVDAGNVDGVGEILEKYRSNNSDRFTVFHFPQTLQELGWGAIRNALIRAVPARVHVVMDLSTVLDGDAISPLAEAISDTVVAAGWRGVNVNLQDEWRSFDDASVGQVDAVLSYLMAVSRTAALTTPINNKAKFYRNADMEWSLALRAAGGLITMPSAELPCHQDRHRGYHDSDVDYRDRESKKTYDRLLQNFRGKTSILSPR